MKKLNRTLTRVSYICLGSGAAFRGLRWNEPDAGYCNKCGQLMTYDHD